jgi:hypothetical protein
MSSWVISSRWAAAAVLSLGTGAPRRSWRRPTTAPRPRTAPERRALRKPPTRGRGRPRGWRLVEPEEYDGTNGWALSGEVDPDARAQDARDAAALFGLLEQEVLPAFYDRDPDGLPRSWLERIRASMRTLAPAFCAGRMLEDYVARIYAPTRPSV